ncbi:MAG: DUF819 family protein [Rhodothermales bacterium]|nr:DUF819 family protein [Rhodothermales bacterium]MBO6779720.1 DUF819 family protein [Rhodothermales bacterium]
MITEPTTLFAVLAGVLGLIFWLSTFPGLKKLFEYLPPVIWAYFVPMFLTTAGVTPDSSETYSWMSRYLLPLALFLLMIAVDVKAILKLGPKALLMMVTGTFGIVLGALVAYLIFASLLPEDAWQGFAALSGSWIGGTANLLFIQNHVGAPDSLLGPIIVVDTVVGYGWMGVLIFLSTMQHKFDKWVNADMTMIEDVNKRLAEIDTTRRPSDLADLAKIVGLGFILVVASIWVAENVMPETQYIGTSTWAILIIVTLGLVLSFTKMRDLEQVGASRLGFLALYLLLTSIGARADLMAVLDAPYYLLAGVVWISIHIGILIIMARAIRAPLFFVATGSMANIGGAASAPVVASVYLPAMAPVGLLMATAGYILGIYAAYGAAEMLRVLAGG